MQVTSSKTKEHVSEKQRVRKANLEQLAVYSSGKGIDSFAGGFPAISKFMPEIKEIVSSSSMKVHKLFLDKTRTYHSQVLLAATVAKQAEGNLERVGEQIITEIKTNNATVKSAFANMESKAATSNHPRSQAIRERLQSMGYGDLQKALNSDEMVAGIYLNDPAMLYDIDEKQRKVISDGLLKKEHPEAYDAQQAQDTLFKSYETLINNAQKLTQMMASQEEVLEAQEMRVEV